ncbi:hypothetical protein KY285_013376 [Solanum tuberosum]|nr:hypothetical protein KY285_013376 [Solanum tuberosum]
MVIDDRNHILLLRCYSRIFIFLFFAKDKLSSITLAWVDGADFRQLAKFLYVTAITYPNALLRALLLAFSFLACYAPASGMLYQMHQPTSGVGPLYANSI